MLLLWALLAAAALGVLVVYWRTPVSELYHVARSGPGEALPRVLSFAGYPSALVALLSFFLAYGSWNVAQDFWLEQVVKRGVTTAEIPYTIAPAPTVAWALVLLLAAGAFLVLRPMLGSPSSAAADPPG